MKHLSFLFLSVMLLSCASHNREIASQEQEDFEHMERAGDFGRENRI